ncbi:MAG: hypothetical protein DIU78_018350, partial [Pseudomonadota bacterium]
MKRTPHLGIRSLLSLFLLLPGVYASCSVEEPTSFVFSNGSAGEGGTPDEEAGGAPSSGAGGEAGEAPWSIG